ncbi:MAG: site-specific DNA-methyltransferase, partial [Dehalococcoidia bacterium]|nr:site-specific DNA-methyltransferase [Dehalococcoidia bacterium]
VVDLVAGSGTTGAAALELGRQFVLADRSEEAFAVMRRRFEGEAGVEFREAPSP